MLAFDAGLVRGALLGAVVGFGVAAFVPLADAPPPVVRPRPSGFDALRAELEAERARAAAAAGADRADAATDAPTVDAGDGADRGAVSRA
jgi:hypothetical protein